jgi:tRNA(Leu) C34 or U34 (ribose-2'-O)-methylase TrmL
MDDNIDLFQSGARARILEPGSIAVKPPALMLVNPKYPHNVGGALRMASCYGVQQVWYTGNRVPIEANSGYRLPREERMRGYKDVDLFNYEYPLHLIGQGVTPVCVEVRRDAEALPDFEHPENAVYIFGPEDGSIPPQVARHCHRFVIIPTRHCLNLATAVGTVLYDRCVKLGFPEEAGYQRMYGDLEMV